MKDKVNHLYLNLSSHKKTKNRFLNFLLIMILIATTILGGSVSALYAEQHPKIKTEIKRLPDWNINLADSKLIDFYNQINEFRKKNGLNELKPVYELERTASYKAQIMINSNCWAHSCGAKDINDPIANIIEMTQYNYVGENLAQGYYTTTDALNAWVASPEHLANLVKPEYKYQGVAIICNINFQSNKNNCLFVHHFGG